MDSWDPTGRRILGVQICSCPAALCLIVPDKHQPGIQLISSPSHTWWGQPCTMSQNHQVSHLHRNSVLGERCHQGLWEGSTEVPFS